MGQTESPEPEVRTMEDILGRHPESLLRGAKRYVTTRKREQPEEPRARFNKATRMLSKAWEHLAREQLGGKRRRPRHTRVWDRWVDGLYGSYNSDDD